MSCRLLPPEEAAGTAGAANLGAPRSLAPLLVDLPCVSLFAESMRDEGTELPCAVEGAAKAHRSLLWSDIQSDQIRKIRLITD